MMVAVWHWPILLVCLLLGQPAEGQCQTQKLLASYFSPGAEFGSDVGMSGDWAVVGAPEDNEALANSGALYVFKRRGGVWTQTQKLKPSPLTPLALGGSVSIAGDVIVAGAQSGAGSAYVFERSGTTWSQTQKLVASDSNGFSGNFGHDVAVSGDRLIIGAHNDSHITWGGGAAYLFERRSGLWTETAKITSSDTASGDQFGKSVAIDGDHALVGSFGDDRPEGTDLGAAYLFQRGASTWLEVQKLIGMNVSDYDRFGVSVALSGSTALIGSVWDSAGWHHAGAAYVFDRQGNTWTFTQILTASDPFKDEEFGGTVALRGDMALIGSIADSAEGSVAGSAYAFHRNGSSWTQIGKLLANDAQASDLLGLGVAIEGDTAIVGAPFEDGNCAPNDDCRVGSAYVFQLAPTARQYGFCAQSAPCANKDADGGCLNSTNQGAILKACGSGSVTGDDLLLETRHLPPSALTLLFMGPRHGYVPAYDGIRVVRGAGGIGLYRYPALAATPQGTSVRGPGLVAHSQSFPPSGRIQPAQTWNFQCWYRNPSGPCGQLTNYSNGVEVAFAP